MQQFLCSKWVWNEERLKTQMSWNIQKVKVKICQTSRNDEKKSNVKDCHTTAKIIRLKLVKTLEVNFFFITKWSGKWLGRCHWWIDKQFRHRLRTWKGYFEKDDIFDVQPKNILIPKANIHLIEDWGEKEEKKSEEESQKERERRKEREPKKIKEIRGVGKLKWSLNWQKMLNHTQRDNSIFLPKWLNLFLTIIHLFNSLLR